MSVLVEVFGFGQLVLRLGRRATQQHAQRERETYDRNDPHAHLLPGDN